MPIHPYTHSTFTLACSALHRGDVMIRAMKRPAWIIDAHAAHRCSYGGDEARRAHSVGAGECARSASEARQRLPRAQGAIRFISLSFDPFVTERYHILTQQAYLQSTLLSSNEQ